MTNSDAILVTGAAGFIGSVVSQQLLESGRRVVGLDNLNDYYDVNLKLHRLENLKKYDNFIFFQYDIEDKKSLKELFHKHHFSAVINLAARAGVRYSMENPDIYMSTNVQGTLNILELMREFKVEKLIIASTSSLYAGLPIPFSEDLPVNTPISPYAASKKAAEMIAYSYHHLYGIDVSILRYFTVYGPAGRPDMSIFRFIKWIDEGTPLAISGDGSQRRDFTFVDDIARGTLLALKRVRYEIVNLGGGNNPTSLMEIITLIEKNLGKKAKFNFKPFHAADMIATYANIDKAEQLFGWRPEILLEVGIKRTVDWYLDNKKFAKQLLV
jgi:UDP-glucuronate 4-epimerase